MQPYAQVLELEATLAEQEEEQARVTRERQREREREATNGHGHGHTNGHTSSPSFGRSPSFPKHQTSPGGSALTDSWAGPPTAGFFLPKIVQLWWGV